MAMTPHCKTPRVLGALAGLLLLGILFTSLHERDPRESPPTRPQGVLEAKREKPLPSRSWPIESLPELGFDQALTLLSSEMESYVKASADSKPVQLARIERVAARLGEMHEENLRKIARALLYYESQTPEVQARFARFRSTYEGRWQSLQRSLAGVSAGEGGAGEEVLSVLRESGALKPPTRVPEAKDLPRRRLPAEAREPRLTPEEWQSPKKVGLAPRGKEQGLLDRLFGVRAAHAQGVDDDLAETPEVKFTAEKAPEIQKLLDDEGLRGSPARIANWVRNNIVFVPIWGALQDSVTCLDNRKGTAMDIASMTIALLRGSGIRARYQAGTVRLPIEEAKNWLGNFESAIAASSLLQSGGIPAAVQVDSAGKPAALRFEHVWVRAYVDYIPYQGACHLEGDTWVDLDTSIRSYEYSELPALSPGYPWQSPPTFLAGFFRDSTLDDGTGAIAGLNLDAFGPELADAIDSAAAELMTSAGSRTFGELYGLGRPMASDLPLLNPAPRFEVLAKGWERFELDPTDRFGVAIEVRSAQRTILSLTFPAAELGAARLALSFRPAAETDRRILIDQLSGDPEDPLDILVAGIQVLPELRRDGIVVQTGESVAMGSPLDLVVDYEEPVLSTEPIRMRILAGELTAIGLDLIGVTRKTLQNITDDLQELIDFIDTGDSGKDPMGLVEVIYSAVIQHWFSQTDFLNTALGSALDCPTFRYPSAGVCSGKLEGDSIFGLPLKVSTKGLSVDIPGDVTLLIHRGADVRRMAEVNRFQGFIGSALEGQVPALLFSSPEEPQYWLTSASAIMTSLKTRGSLVILSSENVEAALPHLRLGTEATEEIRDAVSRGLSVVTPQADLRDKENCHAGYVIVDPTSGNAIYRVSGGLCGARQVKCLEIFLSDKIGDPKAAAYAMDFSADTEKRLRDYLEHGKNPKVIDSAFRITHFLTNESYQRWNAEQTRDDPATTLRTRKLMALLIATEAFKATLHARDDFLEKECDSDSAEAGKCQVFYTSVSAGYAWTAQTYSWINFIKNSAEEYEIDIPCCCFFNPKDPDESHRCNIIRIPPCEE